MGDMCIEIVDKDKEAKVPLIKKAKIYFLRFDLFNIRVFVRDVKELKLKHMNKF